MKYQRWYDALMRSRRRASNSSIYIEVHHILPRSLGGSNTDDNLVRLTYREHFIAHWLLTKIYCGRDLQKMQYALLAMTMRCSGERIIAGWQFEVAKRAIKDLHKARGWKSPAERAKLRAMEKAVRDSARAAGKRGKLARLTFEFLEKHRKVPPAIKTAPLVKRRYSRRRKRPRPGRRLRELQRELAAQNA